LQEVRKVVAQWKQRTADQAGAPQNAAEVAPSAVTGPGGAAQQVGQK
jgi:hypothetical protein